MSEPTPEILSTWATRNLPARLDVASSAKLLGFAEHDIQILMAVGKLRPLGDPAPNAPKWFASIELVRLASDQDWLHKATKEISKHWRQKRERLQSQTRPGRRTHVQRGRNGRLNVSPDSSPEVSPGEQLGCAGGAVQGVE
jgi:hypothetical protein